MSLIALCVCSVLYLLGAATEATNVTTLNVATTKVTPVKVMIFRDVNSDGIVNMKELCDQTACIMKCCPKNHILTRQNKTYICVNNTNFTTTYKLDYSEVDLYDRNIKQNITKSRKKINDFTQIYSENFFNVEGMSVYNVARSYGPPHYEIYILENGILVIRSINDPDQEFTQLATDQFCVDYQIQIQKNDTVLKRPKVVELMLVRIIGSTSIPKNTITAYVLLVSCFFLLLVLVVYSLLPQLRNLAGIMLMAYVSTFITAILFRAVMVIGTDHGQFSWEFCLYTGFMGYYALIASYTWMNVMSFDIWWTMRGFRKSLQVNRRGILVKFGWYSLYGWGASLVPVLFCIIVEHIDLAHLPGFVKPHYSDRSNCFMPPRAQRWYKNGPILVTTNINIALFLMTTYNIWRIKTGVLKHSAGESRKNEKDEIRFGIYLKLSLVMGVFWILEVVSSLYKTDAWFWYITDIFNSLIGLFIFIIFVCKRHIIVLLLKRFSIGEDIVQKWKLTESTRTTIRTQASD